MSVMMVYFMGFVNAFAKFGRWADLLLGLTFAALGYLWANPWMIAAGAFSVGAFAFNLNGWIQRRSMAFARARISNRSKR